MSDYEACSQPVLISALHHPRVSSVSLHPDRYRSENDDAIGAMTVDMITGTPDAGVPLRRGGVSSDFVGAALENWDSEFLQMGMYVVLTAYLFQQGWSESKPIATRRQPAADRVTPRRACGAVASWCLELAAGYGAVLVNPTIARNSPVAVAAHERIFDLQLGWSPHVPGIGDQLAEPRDVDGLQPDHH
jgi:hypothetical protein